MKHISKAVTLNLIPKNIKIALCDDHKMIVQALALFLEQNGFEVVIVAHGSKQLIDSLVKAEILPDVCIFDVLMEPMYGNDAIKTLNKQWPNVRVIVFSTQCHSHLVDYMIKYGVRGYIKKSCAQSEFISCISDVHEKGVHFSELVSPHYWSAMQSQRLRTISFTAAELELFQYFGTKLTYMQIAKVLGCSYGSVTGLRDSIMQKLDMHSRQELTEYAKDAGIKKV